MNLVRCVVPSSCGVHGRIVSAIILDRLNAVSIRAALSAALAVCLFPMGTAQAEPFGPQYRSWEGYDYAPFSPPDRLGVRAIPSHLAKNANARIQNMNRGRRLNPNANARIQ